MVERYVPPKRGRYKKGIKYPGQKHDGRKKGVPNKVTGLLREAVIVAAAQVGENGNGKGELIGYLRDKARRYPEAYLTLLGRVMPLQVKVDGALEVVTAARRYSEADLSRMTLMEKLAAYREIVSLTKPLTEPMKLIGQSGNGNVAPIPVETKAEPNMIIEAVPVESQLDRRTESADNTNSKAA